MPQPNPALLPRPALFDVTIADTPIDRRIERIPLEEIELAPNARREISQDGIERLDPYRQVDRGDVVFGEPADPLHPGTGVGPASV